MSGDASLAQLAALQTVTDAISILSICGSLFIVCAYARYAALRKFAFTLVAALSASDLMNHFFDLIGPTPAELASAGSADASPACLVQALGNAEFELASVLWTGAIASALYAQVFLGWRPERVAALWPRFVLICFCAPAALALLPLVAAGPRVYGPSGSWCWLRPSQTGWIFGVFYVPVWLTMIFNAIIYARTFAKLQALLQRGSNGDAVTDAATAAKLTLVVERLKYYPYILLVVWLPASVSRVAQAALGGRALFPLLVLHRVCSSSQGLLNAIAYGLSRGVREAVRGDAHALLPGCVSAPAVQLDDAAEPGAALG
jgi:hypothetical protein